MSAPPTAEQIEELLNFLDSHHDLARGNLRSIEGRVQSQRLWEEITNLLNSRGGCTKTVQQWQRVWTDKKYMTKKAAAAAKRSATGTGGGPSTAPDLSERELKVLSIMGDGFGEPQTSARIAVFTEPEISQPPPPNLASPAQSTGPSTRATSQRSSRTRTLRQLSDDSIRERLFRSEEERNEINRNMAADLGGIRAALTELTNIMGQILEEMRRRNQTD